jgi:hypothetical protein
MTHVVMTFVLMTSVVMIFVVMTFVVMPFVVMTFYVMVFVLMKNFAMTFVSNDICNMLSGIILSVILMSVEAPKWPNPLK